MKLPTILKHCVMAVIRDGKVKGPMKKKFEGAMDICRANLARHGYLTAGSATGPLEKVKLTGKGEVRERHHKHGEGRATTEKTAAFDALFKQFHSEPTKPQPKKPDPAKPVKIPKADDQM